MIRNALVVAGKEFRHMKHDRLTLALTFLLPALQLILYGYAFDTRIRNLPTAIINLDPHGPARLLEERFSNSPLLRVSRIEGSDDRIEAALRDGTVRAAIRIPSDYSVNLVRGKPTRVRVWLDGSDVLTASYALAGLETLTSEVTSASLPVAPATEIEPKIMFNAGGRTASYLIPGLIGILVQLVTTLLMALSLTGERERGTLEQLAISPLGTGAILGGKIVAIGCVGLVQSASLILLMRWLFGITIQGSAALLAAVTPLLVLSPLGLGLLVAARARSQMQALQMTQLIFLPSVMLSGFIWPREFLTYPVNVAGSFLPATYLVSLTRSIVLRGAGGGEVAHCVEIATVFGVGLIAAGCYAMRRSLRG